MNKQEAEGEMQEAKPSRRNTKVDQKNNMAEEYLKQDKLGLSGEWGGN